MCVTHGMSCVIMHGPFETYKYGSSHSVLGAARFSSWEQQGEGGGREKRRRRKGKVKGRKGEEKWRKRKEKERRKEEKKKEEKRKKKEEKEGVSHSKQTHMKKNSELRYKR